jgi:hypothetical protein
MLKLPPIKILIAMTTLAVIFAGCRTAEPTIIGQWEPSASSPASRSLTITSNSIEIEAKAMGQSITLSGDLKAEKNRLTISNLSLPPEIQQAAASSGTNLDLTQTINATFSFKNPNEVVISGSPLVEGAYKRKGTTEK